MSTASDAYTDLRTLINANIPVGLTGGARWQGEDNVDLPETPAPFAYIEFLTDPARLVGFGGGPRRNLYRNPGRLVFYVFVPKGAGLKAATDLAEGLVAPARSYRSAVVSCFAGSVLPGGDGDDIAVKPMGLRRSDASNYYYAVGEVDLHFDQIG